MKKLIVLMFSMILLIGSITALEFDNVKDYDPITKTVTIKNAFGLGEDIAEVQLKSNLKVLVPRGYNKVAEFEIRAKEDYTTILKELEFYNRNEGDQKFIRSYDYRYKTINQVLVDDYNISCSESIAKNGSIIRDCSKVKIGDHYEDKEEWLLAPANVLKNDVITIGIFTDVKEGDKVEWIPNIMGVRVEEWADWEESISVGLVSYYNMEQAGSILTDVVRGIHNGTLVSSPTWVGGKIGNGLNFVSASSQYVRILDHNDLDFGTDRLTIAYWINYTTVAGTSIDKGYTGSNLAYRSGNMDAVAEKFGTFDGGWHTINYNTYTVDTWHFIVTRWNGTQISTWKDGTQVGQVDFSGAIPNGNWNLTLGTYIPNNKVPKEFLNGIMDELGFWNRSLSDGEITTLYAGGDGMSYGVGGMGGVVTSTLLAPVNSFNTTLTTIDFSSNSTSTVSNLTNVTLYIWNSNNSEYLTNLTSISGLNNITNWSITSIPEGSYIWNALAKDEDSAEDWGTNRTFLIDTTKPAVNITYPINGSSFITFTPPYNLTLNFTSSDDNLGSCWYNNLTANITITCGVNTSINLGGGYNTIIYYANDTLGNENSNSTTVFINTVIVNATYNDPILEGENQTITLNITATDLNQLNGTLIYNGTSYNTTASFNSTVGGLHSVIVPPNVTETVTIYNFYWSYSLNNVSYNSSIYNQTINLINITVASTCPIGLDSSMYWDFKLEENLTAVTGDINYNFKVGNVNSSFKNVFGSLSNVSGFYLCINTTVNSNYSLGYGEIQYERTGFADRRFYTFTTQILTNVTVNNTLYFLINSDATSFLFDFKNTALTPYINKYSSLLRWFPNLNQYIVVEMAKTDDKGATIMRVKVEDVDYRVGLYHPNGTIIKLLSPVRFACLSAPCSYSTLVEENPNDYTSYFGVETSIVYNTTSEIWTYTWNDPSQNTENMSFKVTRDRGDQTFTICDTSASGFTGVLTCDSTGYTGTLRAVAYRTASPVTPIAQKIINTGSTAFSGSLGLFISFIIFLALALIGVYSPVISIILGIVGLIPAYIFGSISLPVFIAIGVIGGITIHFMKRTG